MDNDGALVRASVSVIATSHELGRLLGISLRDAFTRPLASPTWLVRRPKIDPRSFGWGGWLVYVYPQAILLSALDKYGAVLQHRSLRDVTQRAARKLARFVDGGPCIWCPDSSYPTSAIGSWASAGATVDDIVARAHRELSPPAASLDACTPEDWYIDELESST